MAHEVVFSPEAQTDLIELYDYIAPRGGPERALAYVERIQASCMSLGLWPERGTRRNDIRPGLRVTGFERRVTIALLSGKTGWSSTASSTTGVTWRVALATHDRRWRSGGERRFCYIITYTDQKSDDLRSDAELDAGPLVNCQAIEYYISGEQISDLPSDGSRQALEISVPLLRRRINQSWKSKE